MKNFSFFILFISLVVVSCQENIDYTENKELSAYVDPFIGTGGHGHTYPGCTLPFGMVQLSPDTRLEGWDGCSGYHFSDSIIYGFSHTHLSGTGVSDYGDVLLMPIQGDITLNNGYNNMEEPNYSSSFSKHSEEASPGYYGVHLNKHDVDVQLSVTPRVGIHEYTFNQISDTYLILDLAHRDMLLDHSMRLVNDHEIEGHRISKAWAQEQHIYFVMQFSKTIRLDSLSADSSVSAIHVDMNGEEKLMVKVGISAVDIDGARKNLESEATSWDFASYQENANRTWNEALSKIQIKDKQESKKIIFYSALYHSMIAPNLFSDVDMRYRGMDQKIHTSENGPVYTVFSLWDTFRATHPLFTIIEQEKTNEFIRTFLKQYQEGGELPIWELAGNYTGCMIGYHSIPVIVDAYKKGIRDYDAELALEAMLHSANMDKLGLDAYKENGFIASGDEAESVSKNLEYAYDDWCIAMMAKELGDEETYTQFIRRAQYYQNLFNPETGFMQSKLNAAWNSGFDPAEVNFNFTEANSWQYSMFAPQDIEGIISIYGGKEKFAAKLDELFNTEMELSGRHQSDITGLIGQYAHGNEPSHHMAYLYNYVEQAWKTQERVSQILKEQYSNLPDGLSGNEDCGQMSSWYVLSSIGFYSVTPGSDLYSIGTPHHDEATINLENGEQFSIIASNLSDENIYIQSALLNGKELNRAILSQQEIMAGGSLTISMGPKPNKNWGTSILPGNGIKDRKGFVAVPYFVGDGQTFSDSMKIELKSIDTECELFYQINDEGFKKYQSPLLFLNDTKIKAYAKKGENKSFEVKASYKKIKGGRSIELISAYSNQYSAGGDNGLIDYLKGSDNFRTGYWQGYYENDFAAIVDLGEIEKVNYISIGALQDIKSWIWYPKQVRISISNDKKSFKELCLIKNDFPDNEYGAFTKEFEKNLKGKAINTRYIKIEAENYGPCPEWHLGNGNPTWLFFDEIKVE